MSFSINTNVGALVALQNLSSIDARLQTTQNRISTGYEVSSARDDGAIYAIAENLRADVKGFAAVQSSLDRGISTVDTALAAGDSISDLLGDLKAKALSASDASLDTSSRAALNEDFVSLRDQISTIVTNAGFNGVNLIDGSVTTSLNALANVDGSTIAVNSQDFSLGATSGVLTLSATADLSTVTAATTALSQLDASIDALGTALARLGTDARALDIQRNFVQTLSDETETGIGNLVDADLARESAELQALQVQQQLASQALSIANQAPNTILSLFR